MRIFLIIIITAIVMIALMAFDELVALALAYPVLAVALYYIKKDDTPIF